MWQWLVISPRRTLHPSSSELAERNYVSKESGKSVEFPPVCRNIVWNVGIGMEKKVKGLHWIILKLFPSPNSSMILGSAGLSIQGKKVPRTAAGAVSHLRRKPFPWDQAAQNGFVYMQASKPSGVRANLKQRRKTGEEGDLFQTFPLLFCLTLVLKHSLFEVFSFTLLVFGACLFAGDGSDRSICKLWLTPVPITHPH